MNYSFSIKLTKDSPENLSIEITGQPRTELTERFKAYDFNAEEGRSIRVTPLRSDANIIIENTGTAPFIWKDDVSEIRLHLQSGQRKQVSIPARTGPLYPYSEKSNGRINYFETKEGEMFNRSVICLFFTGTRTEPLPYNGNIERIVWDILDEVRYDTDEHKKLYFIVKDLPINKAEFFDFYYVPAMYPMRTYRDMAFNAEQGKLLRAFSTHAGHVEMTAKQVSELAAPIPIEQLQDEPLGEFVGFQYLVVKPGNEAMEDVQFYVAAPPPQ
ncbi:hypothetical protein [Pseudomonas sp. nanlin1]|uniref:hypothetical protein n=1 Tax=Pseudomonas sp. nanlin1 TaxID=3040605 RepID=UPI00388E34E0